MKQKTLFDKIWDAHVVRSVKGGPDILYIDRHYLHEVTSPQAFNGLRSRGLEVFRPERTVATADHNIPTLNQHLPIEDAVSGAQVEALADNTRSSGIEYWGIGHPMNGIVHVAGPGNGYTLPGMTVVCGDSHTSTHGAFGTIAFGIGTSEVEMVLASQCILQDKPATMRITVNGSLQKGVTSKDLILYIISSVSSGGATGYFVEYAGECIRQLSMESRMTICNMSIEMGARGGLIAPDDITFTYLQEIPSFRNNPDAENMMKSWQDLFTDPGATFDRELEFDASVIPPMITYGTNPGMGMPVNGVIPPEKELEKHNGSYARSLAYMGFKPGMKLLGHPVDYVFLGSCTNGRIEDVRAFASVVRGRKKAPGIVALIVPGSWHVARQAESEGLVKILNEAGFEMRQPGCSSCLAMNDDKIPSGRLVVSTTNRNFEGRQGPGSRTILAGPLTAAAAAITGMITDPRYFL